MSQHKKKFTYTLEYDHRDIIVHPEKEIIKMYRKILESKPDADLSSALDCFCNRFFPDISADERPWHKHKEIADSIRKGKITDPFKHKVLKNKEILEWPLAWYWKALFTALPEFFEHNSKTKKGTSKESTPLTVQISQIRQWTLVLVYLKSRGSRKLLRPPLFGKSDRLRHWDQYFVLYSFCDAIKNEWLRIESDSIQSKKIYGHHLHQEQWYVVGRHDIFYHFTLNKDFGKDLKKMTVELSVDANFSPHIITPPLASFPEKIKKMLKNKKEYVHIPSLLAPFTLNEKVFDQWAKTKRPSDSQPKGKSNKMFIADYLKKELHKHTRKKSFYSEEKCLSYIKNLIKDYYKNKKSKVDSILDTYAKQILSKAIRIPQIHYPYDFISIPVFENTREKLEDESILLASDSVCQAFETLSEIWNDKTTRSVLIISPPGSGKEKLADSIYRFQNINGEFISYALSPSSHERNDSTLFSREFELHFRISANKNKIYSKNLIDAFKETYNWAKNKREPTKKIARFMYDGLLFLARNGVLFLDEIDKVPEQTRSSLLRLLENDEFAVYNTSMVLRIKETRPLYVFAGSTPIKEMFQLKPFDFWTRISHIVEMNHPLDVNDEQEKKRILRNYFTYFWYQHLPNFFDKSDLFTFSSTNLQFFLYYYIRLYSMLNYHEVVDKISKTFSDEILSGTVSKSFSIRNIRSIAARIIYSLVDHFLYDKSNKSALVKVRNHVMTSNNCKENITAWFDTIAELISGDAKVDEKVLQYELSEEIRNIVRSAIRKVYV